MSDLFGPTITGHLKDLDKAAEELANTWQPDDPVYRADVYRQAMMSLSYSYFAYFHATPEHPDWAPLWNPVYSLQPNPDDIYFYAPLRGDLTYRVSGNRGTCHILSFTTQQHMSGMVDAVTPPNGHNEVDDEDLGLAKGEDFSVIFSAERPAGYDGKWARIDPAAGGMMVRMRAYDWENEVDANLAIECLDPVPPKPRVSPADIKRGIEEMARFPQRKTRNYFKMQNAVKDAVGWNVFQPIRYERALVKQTYWPAVFQLDDDEALIIETEIPERARYWNIQLNDPYFSALEYVYRCSSTNGAMARLSGDGKLRAVIAMTDPGVPNWLDPAGFNEGGIYGRWYDCSSEPVPTITRVKLAELREHMPADTPVVTHEERAEELRRRVRACQLRRRW